MVSSGLRSSRQRIEQGTGFEQLTADLVEFGPRLGIERLRFALRFRRDGGVQPVCRIDIGLRRNAGSGIGSRGRRERAADVRILAGRDGTWRAILQQLLHAPDRISVLIEPLPDPTQQPDVLGPVIASAAAAFHGSELRKLRLPETQHMRRKIEFVGNLSDGAKRGGAFLRPSRRRSAGIAHLSPRLPLRGVPFRRGTHIDSRGRGEPVLGAIYLVFQRMRGAEDQNPSRTDRDLLAGFWVAPDALTLV